MSGDDTTDRHGAAASHGRRQLLPASGRYGTRLSTTRSPPGGGVSAGGNSSPAPSAPLATGGAVAAEHGPGDELMERNLASDHVDAYLKELRSMKDPILKQHMVQCSLKIENKSEALQRAKARHQQLGRRSSP